MCIVGLALSGVSLLISLYGIVAGAGIVISTLRVMECRRKNKNGRICAILGIVIGVVSVAYTYIMMRIWVSLIIYQGEFSSLCAPFLSPNSSNSSSNSLYVSSM